MEENTVLVPQQAKDLIKEALGFLDSIQEIVIKDESQYQNAVKSCQEIKRLNKLLEGEKKTLTEPYYRPYKDIMAEFKDPIDSLKGGETKFKRAMTAYAQEKQRRQIAEQRKRDAEAAEIRRKAEEKAQKEAEKADEYRNQGKTEMAEKADMRAETALEKAVETVAPEVEDQTKAKGLSFRTDYVCEIEDKKAAILFMVENPMFIDSLDIDIGALNRAAKTFKGNLVIPGIRVIPKQIPIVRT